MDQGRTILNRRAFPCADTEKIADWFRAIGDFEVVVEASATYEWFAKLVEPLAQRFVLCHPKKMRIIAESTRKSDKLDAKVLAEFLALDMIPEAHVPLPRQRQQQSLVRQRRKLQGRLTSAKNRLRALLARYNADRTDLFSSAGLEYLASVPLSTEDRFVRKQMMRELAFHTKELACINTRLGRYAKKALKREGEARELLTTVPGVGPVTIDVWMSEIGDVRRFSSAKKLVSYCGLDPGFRSSDEKTRELSITKEGSRVLRWALIEAAWNMVRTSAKWRRVFEGIAARRGKKKAIVGIARRLASVMYAMLRDGCRYSASLG